MEIVRIQLATDPSLLPVYQEAARRYPDDPLIFIFLIEAHRLRGEEAEAQRLGQEFDKKMSMKAFSKPQQPDWYNALFQQIKQELEQNHTLDIDASPFSEDATCRQNQLKWIRSRMREMVTGMIPQRLAVYKEAAKRFPRDPFILVTLWQALEAHGREQEAEQVMNTLVALWENGECQSAWSESVGEDLPEEMPPVMVSSYEVSLDEWSSIFEDTQTCNIDELQWYNRLFDQIEKELEGNE